MRRLGIAVLCFLLLFAGAAGKEETVAFNTESYKYHCLSCSSAKACTRNCIDIPRSEAQKRGGVACKRCGGTCQ
jgi:DNA-directed RNA polymerase subunit RPC12/RpoP